MRKVLLICGFFCLAFSIIGCALISPRSQTSEAGLGIIALPPYSGAKVKVVVADFDLKAAKASAEAGAGLREMLASALSNSNRFLVIDRQKTGTTMNKVSDIIIATSVTEFEPQSSGGSAGIGSGGGAASGTLGGLLGVSVNKAHLALDVRIIDAATSQIFAATRVQGQAADSVSGSSAAGSLGLGDGLTAYTNTPMEKAIRVCIAEAVRFISLGTPGKYYRY
ncbi:MAG: CsgG/HfaB family protein [Candidatus Omnitrophica bacterium]|nr:CsgG/HfaB family protein [Candidatus Omnitrophota bacterium]